MTTVTVPDLRAPKVPDRPPNRLSPGPERGESRW